MKYFSVFYFGRYLTYLFDLVTKLFLDKIHFLSFDILSQQVNLFHLISTSLSLDHVLDLIENPTAFVVHTVAVLDPSLQSLNQRLSFFVLFFVFLVEDGS
jgi:hypothetical protein